MDDQATKEPQEEDHHKANEFNVEEDELTTYEEGEDEIQPLGVKTDIEGCSIEEVILIKIFFDSWENVESFTPREGFEHFLCLPQSESSSNTPTKASAIENIKEEEFGYDDHPEPLIQCSTKPLEMNNEEEIAEENSDKDDQPQMKNEGEDPLEEQHLKPSFQEKFQDEPPVRNANIPR
ncbi:unnamed protein product [Linum trigynum]|uniref:Uncharacterized protein n=1 Tax=Linum trigynum TaxID=586398 RepID=A0AAV2DZT9_9ROSI